MNKHSRALQFILFLSLSISLILTACSDARTSIVFVFLSSSPDTLRAYWQDVIVDFEAANPDVRVDLRVYKWKDGQPEINRMIEEGRPPDLINEGVRRVPEYVAAGLVELVDDYLTPEFKEQFIPLFIEEGSRYQGRTFGLPMSLSARVLYYNKDLLARAGYDAPPQSWEELRAVALAVSRLSPAGENSFKSELYGFGIPASPGTIETSTYFYYFLWGNGGQVFSPDGTKAGFGASEGVEALTFLNELVQSGATPPDPWVYTRQDIEDAFIAGKLGMVITLPGLVNRLAQEAPDLDFGLATIPFNVAPVTPLVEDTLIMFKTSEHKDVTWRFIEFIYQDEYRRAYADLVGVLPEKITVAQDPDIAARYAFFLELVPDGKFEPLNIESAEVGNLVGEAVRQVYQGQLDPAAALEAAAAQAVERLAYSAGSW